MVKVDNFDDFMGRVVGDSGEMRDAIDLTPKKESGVSGSFVILFKGKMNESTANRLKKVITKHGNREDYSTDIYLGVPIDGSNEPRLIRIGSVWFTLQVYKEISSIFSQYHQQTEYKIYNENSYVNFNPDDLISTIKFKKPNRKEQII